MGGTSVPLYLFRKEIENELIRKLRKILGKLNFISLIIILISLLLNLFIFPFLLYRPNAPNGDNVLEQIETKIINEDYLGSVGFNKGYILYKSPIDENYFISLRDKENQLVGAFMFFVDNHNLSNLDINQSFFIQNIEEEIKKPSLPGGEVNYSIKKEVIGSIEEIIKKENFIEEYNSKYGETKLGYEKLNESDILKLFKPYRLVSKILNWLVLLILVNSLMLIIINQVINNIEKRKKKRKKVYRRR